MNLTRIAHLWAGLMTELGYDRFLFSGTDMGAGVGLGLVRNYPDRLVELTNDLIDQRLVLIYVEKVVPLIQSPAVGPFLFNYHRERAR